MATLHNIGELLRSGVRPTDEETEHLRELGGFVAEMYGRFMGGHAEHLASPADLWSGRLSKRLSATTGARWEHGIGLAEMLLGSELTSFWQVANQGFSEGYGDFGGEMPMLALYEEEAPAAIAAAVDAAPARRRPSLFGSRQPAGARGRLNPAKLAKLAGRSTDGAVPRASGKAAEGARWRDGGLAEMTVIKALSEGGLYLGDQLSAPVASLELARRREAASAQRSGSMRVDASDVARVARGASAQRASEKSVVLDGVRIDGRTPALAAALSRADAVFGRGASAASERAAISESRMASLTASPSVSLDRGLGMGERPVYGFYDAVETSFLRLQDETAPAAAIGGEQVATARRVAAGRTTRSSMPASANSRGREEQQRSSGAMVGSAAAGRPVGRASAKPSQAAAIALDDVVVGGSGLRPFTGGVFGARDLASTGQRSSLSGQPAELLFASGVTYDRAGRAVPKVQRGAMFAPRSMLVEGRVAMRPAQAGADQVLAGLGGLQMASEGGAVQGGATPASPAASRPFVAGAAQVAGDMSLAGTPFAPISGAGVLGRGDERGAGGAGSFVGVGDSSSARGTGSIRDLAGRPVGTSGVLSIGALGLSTMDSADAGSFGAAFARAGVGTAGPSWHLAFDGGPDLPLGAAFSRHETFAGERLNPAVMASGDAEAFRPIVAGGAGRPSELSQALDGMVWVTLPQDGREAQAPGEGLPLATVPRGRRAAMVPASLAFQAMKGASQRAVDVAALRSGSGVAAARSGGVEVEQALSALRASTVGAPTGSTALGAEAFSRSVHTGGSANTLGERVMAALRSGRLESVTSGRAATPSLLGLSNADGSESSGVVGAAGTTFDFGISGATAPARRALALAGDRQMLGEVGAVRGTRGAALVEQQALRAARYLERAVAQDGYGHIESERELLRQEAEREVGTLDGATVPARRARGVGRASASGRGLESVSGRGATSGRGSEAVGAVEQRVSRLAEAKAALLRPVPTAREARAVADAFGPMGFVATQARSSLSGLSFDMAGSDEPVLGRLLAARGAQRAEVSVGERWELGASFDARIASLGPERQREVARVFRAAGWGEQELEMLRIERAPGIDAADVAASVATARSGRSAAARRAGTAGVAGGSAEVAGLSVEPAGRSGGASSSDIGRIREASSSDASKFSARVERLGRNLTRVALGAEALAGSVAEREAGAASMAAARGGASTWLPLLGAGGGSSAAYFGGLAPGVRTGGAGFASMRDAVGDLVAIAEASVGVSDSPVALTARREVLRRAIAAAQRGFGGAAERSDLASVGTSARSGVSLATDRGQAQFVASGDREIGVQALVTGSKAGSPVAAGGLDSAMAARFEALEAMGSGGAGGARDLVLSESERTMVGLERDSVVAGLEGRLAEALALSASGPAGARRLLRGKVRTAASSEEVGSRRVGRGREPGEAELVRQTVREGARPERISAVHGEAAAVASGGRRMGLADRGILGRDVEVAQAGRAEGLGAAVSDGPKLGYAQVGGVGDFVRGVDGAQVAAIAEERGRHLPVALGKVMAPEAMLQGLRSRELTQAMSAVSTRQAQYGHQMVPVLTTLADAGVDLGAARSSLASRSQAGRVGGLQAMGAAAEAGAGQVGFGGGGLGLFGGSSGGATSSLAGRAPEQSLVQMLAESGGLEGGVAAMALGGRGLGRRQRAGMLSSILRGTERAEMAALLEQAGGRDFAFAWLNRVDGSRSGLDIGMGATRQEFGKAFGARRESLVSGDSPISGASLVQTAPARSEDRSGLRSVASTVVSTSTGAARPQHGASAAMRRTDWSFVDTGSRASTTHADLGKLASAIVGSADSSVRAPMPLVAPAAKAVAQTALRDSKTQSAAAGPSQGAKPAAAARGPVDAKMSEKAVEMLAIEMANRVARLMGLMKERIGVWS